jgi:hypothetical protein
MNAYQTHNRNLGSHQLLATSAIVSPSMGSTEQVAWYLFTIGRYVRVNIATTDLAERYFFEIYKICLFAPLETITHHYNSRFTLRSKLSKVIQVLNKTTLLPNSFYKLHGMADPNASPDATQPRCGGQKLRDSNADSQVRTLISTSRRS